jgi:dethiobiotin synthetase
MAAEALGLPPFRAHELVSEIAFPEHVDVGLVETVGGVRSPLAIDGDSTDLSVALSPTRVLLVADAGLGTVNAVRLSVAALASRDPVVFLNRFDEADDLHRRNRRWLLEQDRLPVETEVGALPGALGLV